jgi:hypothetical protein
LGLGHKPPRIFPVPLPLEHAAVRSPPPGRFHRYAWVKRRFKCREGRESPTSASPDRLRRPPCLPWRAWPCHPNDSAIGCTVNSCPRLTPLLLPWLLGAGELGLGHQNAANASGASSAIASAPPAASARLAAALPAAASPTMSSRAPSTPATSAATAGATSSTRSTRCSGTDSSMTTGSSRTPSPRSPPIAGPW